MDNQFNHNSLIQELREAFSCLGKTPALVDLELEQPDGVVLNIVELRSHLVMFYPEDIQELLPGVLIEILNTTDRSDIEMVIYLLDVPTYEDEEYLAELGQHIGGGYAEKVKRSNEELRAGKMETFSIFNSAQALAIRNWLLIVEEWEELNFIKGDVQSAIKYWSDRASE